MSPHSFPLHSFLILYNSPLRNWWFKNICFRKEINIRKISSANSLFQTSQLYNWISLWIMDYSRLYEQKSIFYTKWPLMMSTMHPIHWNLLHFTNHYLANGNAYVGHHAWSMKANIPCYSFMLHFLLNIEIKFFTRFPPGLFFHPCQLHRQL